MAGGPVPLATASSRPAELDRRLYAFALDRLVLWGTYAAAGAAAWSLPRDDGRPAAGAAVLVGVVLLAWLLSGLLVGLRGTSPGRAALGLRVVHEETRGPIGVPAALLRGLLLGLAALPTAGTGLAALAWTAVADASGRRRGVHDRLTSAVVVDARPAPVADAEVPGAPRQVVNLTALRLVPAPAVPPAPAAAPAPGPGPAAGEQAVAHATGSGPARWRVCFDSGESVPVDGLVLVGRRPEARRGDPVRHLVPLRSGDLSLSRTHAQLQVAPDGVLVVMDRGSANGSVLVRRGVLRPLTAGRAATLVEGDVLLLGDRRMTVVREG